ncbi:MAG: hypothetical protein K9N34_00220 [Candidatus Marinimicrobia bacterium]|nr:hypothetical protein [Candidatus Neomarinimicrobiota bacterium]MCF7839184.1 hypothetical protein [Candidatus Neomarinimicrobiota bacterium]
MKIDLLKDKGLLDPQEFQERVAPNLRTDTQIERADHDSKAAKSNTRKPEPPPIPPVVDQPKESVKGLFVVLGALAIIIVLGFLYKQGTLDPIIAEFKPVPAVADTADTTGERTDFPFLLDSLEILRIEDSLYTVLADSVLPQDIFEQFLPAPSYISTTDEDTLTSSQAAAVPDSGETRPGVSDPEDQDIVEEKIESQEDTVTTILNDTDTVTAEIDSTPPMRHYTNLDSLVVTNQTMFQLAANLVGILNQSGGRSHLYLDRNRLELETDNGKQGVRESVLSTIRPVTDGPLHESDQPDRFTISGRFQYIIEVPRAYEPETGDIHFILEKLVGPFHHYISHIITELDGGIDANPVQIMVTGNHWVMRAILEHWSQLPINFILNDLTIQQGANGFESVVNLTLIRYD